MKITFTVANAQILPVELTVSGMTLKLAAAENAPFQPMNIVLDVEPIAVEAPVVEPAAQPEPVPQPEPEEIPQPVAQTEPEEIPEQAELPQPEPVEVPQPAEVPQPVEVPQPEELPQPEPVAQPEPQPEAETVPPIFVTDAELQRWMQMPPVTAEAEEPASDPADDDDFAYLDDEIIARLIARRANKS